MKSEIKWPSGQVTFCDSECNLDDSFRNYDFKEYISELSRSLASDNPFRTIKFKKAAS